VASNRTVRGDPDETRGASKMNPQKQAPKTSPRQHLFAACWLSVAKNQQICRNPPGLVDFCCPAPRCLA